MKSIHDITIATCHACGQEMRGADYLRRLRADVQELESQRDTLAVYVNNLARRVRDFSPNNNYADRAINYLCSKGLRSGIMRQTPT